MDYLPDRAWTTAILMALERKIDSMTRKLNQNIRGLNRNFKQQMDDEIMGARAEMAVAYALKLPLHKEPGRGHLPDVGNLQVRSCRPGWSLILRPDDKEGEVFVLVWIEPEDWDSREYTIKGWLRNTAEARALAWKVEPDGAHFIGADDLRPIAELPKAER